MAMDPVIVSAVISGAISLTGLWMGHRFLLAQQEQKHGLDDRGKLTRDLMDRLNDEVERLETIQQRYEQALRLNSFMYGELVTIKALCQAILQLIQMPEFDREQIKHRLEEIDHRISSVEGHLIADTARLENRRHNEQQSG